MKVYKKMDIFGVDLLEQLPKALFNFCDLHDFNGHIDDNSETTWAMWLDQLKSKKFSPEGILYIPYIIINEVASSGESL